MTDIGPETMATPENNFKKSWLKWRAQNSWKKVGSEVNVHFIYALVVKSVETAVDSKMDYKPHTFIYKRVMLTGIAEHKKALF